MRSESVREAGATFLLGMLLASAVITVGQVGVPAGMFPFTPPAVWDSYEALTVPFDRSEPIAEARREVAAPVREYGVAGQSAASDRGPAMGPASVRLSGRTDADPTSGDERASKRRDAPRRDESASPRRNDRVSSPEPTDGRGASGSAGKGAGRSATQGGERRAAHGSPASAVTQRPDKVIPAALQRDRTSVDDRRDAKTPKDKTRAGKARSQRSRILKGRPA